MMNLIKFINWLRTYYTREWLNQYKIQNYEDAYKLIFEYIETFYNTVRIHSHCNYQSPNQYEKSYVKSNWISKEISVWLVLFLDVVPPAEQLAVEIDRFSHDYDVYSYRNNNPNMTESVSEISEMIVQGNTEPITDWLNEVISEGALPDEMQRAKVLLEKLAEYKPLAKIEEMEEQNYNMIDNVLNNGAEKAQREANKKDQEQPAVKVSLKVRLAEKKAQVAGSGQEHEVQENTKKNQREV